MSIKTEGTNEIEKVTQSIVVVRSQRVLLDAALAALYGVPTKALNQAVKRNSARFPPDFLLRPTPLAFTEHGALMAATVLNSPRAVEMSVFIVRAFVQLRRLFESNVALTRHLDELEEKYRDHDQAIAAILTAIRNLMSEPSSRRRGIGFTADLEL